MPGIMLVALSIIHINKDCLKDKPKMEMFRRKWRVLMVKSKSEGTVFLLADLLRYGAKETAKILVKEVVWREGLCSLKPKKERKWKKEIRTKKK